MKEAFEKILERLDEELRKSEERYYRYLDDSNLPCMFDKSDIEEKRVDTIKEMLEIVQEVAEEYNGGWIACSERLPEESGYYLVTYHDWSDGNFLPKYDDTYVRRLHYQISEHFVGWNYPKNVDDRAENDCHKEVIAWQPLPEPFKERD